MSAPSRINIPALQPEIWKTIKSIDESLKNSALDPRLWELVKIRASQINKCVFCIDLHTKEATQMGEEARRIFALNAWRESPLFDEGEKAVLQAVDEVTEISRTGLSAETYASLKNYFNEQSIALVLIAISQINFLNRIAVSTAMHPKI